MNVDGQIPVKGSPDGPQDKPAKAPKESLLGGISRKIRERKEKTSNAMHSLSKKFTKENVEPEISSPTLVKRPTPTGPERKVGPVDLSQVQKAAQAMQAKKAKQVEEEDTLTSVIINDDETQEVQAPPRLNKEPPKPPKHDDEDLWRPTPKPPVPPSDDNDI